MKNFLEKILLMDKADEDGAAGGTPPAPPKQDPPPNPPDNPPPPKEGDKQYDEHGYEILSQNTPPGDKKPEGDKSKETSPEKSEKVENPATGYGDKEPVIEDVPPDPNAPPAPPPPDQTEIEKKLEGLTPSFLAVAKKQIEDLGLKGEQLDKFIAFKKQEQKDAETWSARNALEVKRQEQLRNQEWHKELQKDPAFGGDKFTSNITRAEKILDQYGAELKKELTDAKVVLRPSVMRMLARLADDLYPDRKLVQGDPPAPEGEADKDKKLNPLDFYTN